MKRFASAQALDAALAESMLETLSQALQTQARASIAVSGGSTPRGLFSRLAESAFEWDRVDIFQVDERKVSPDHPDSNQALLRKYLLKDLARAARFHPLPALAEKLDLLHLGMGEDGHFASLFPDSPAEYLQLNHTEAIVHTRAPNAPYERLSLNLAEICRAKRIVLQFVGEKKHEAFLQAQARGTPIAKLKAALGERLEVFSAD